MSPCVDILVLVLYHLMRRRREMAIPARRGVDGRKDDAVLLVARI